MSYSPNDYGRERHYDEIIRENAALAATVERQLEALARIATRSPTYDELVAENAALREQLHLAIVDAANLEAIANDLAAER